MSASAKKYVACCLVLGLAIPISRAAATAPFDPSRALKDYAGTTIIGSKSSANGRSDSVIAGEHAAKCAELQLRNCTGLQVQVYPAFQGSWPDAAPETLEKITFRTEGLSALVNWGLNHKQETLHHMMIGPNQYFPEWFWKNKYTAEELDQLLKRYITTLMTANDNKRKMDGWNIFNEMGASGISVGFFTVLRPDRG